MDKQKSPEEPSDSDDTISPYAPPPRRGGLTRNLNMLAVLAITVLALVVVVVILAVD